MHVHAYLFFIAQQPNILQENYQRQLQGSLMMKGSHRQTNQLHDINWGALDHVSCAPQLISCNYCHGHCECEQTWCVCVYIHLSTQCYIANQIWYAMNTTSCRCPISSILAIFITYQPQRLHTEVQVSMRFFTTQ